MAAVYWLIGDAAFISPSRSPAPWVRGTLLAFVPTPASGIAEKALLTDGEPPSLTIFHEVVQRLNKAERDLFPNSIRLTSRILNTLLKILSKRKRLKIFI